MPGLAAKPIIDVLVEMVRIEDADPRAADMEQVGFEALGEYGIPGRRYFRRDADDGTRLVNVHAFAAGSEGAVRHLVFRDYLRAHNGVAAEYGALKASIAAGGVDIEAYMDAKDAFVRSAERDALAWSEGGCR